MNVDFEFPKEFFQDLPKNHDDYKAQMKERHILFSKLGCFPKKKESLFCKILESPFKWISYPVTGDKLFICRSMYSIGLHITHKHPELCINGKIPVKEGYEIIEALSKMLPIEPGKEIKLKFGHVTKTEIIVKFRSLTQTEISEKLPECVDFYKFYFDSPPFKCYFCDLPKDFLDTFNSKKLDEKLTEESKIEADNQKKCWMCKKEETPSLELKVCARCGKARYCSRECQVKHWKEHKKDCRK